MPDRAIRPFHAFLMFLLITIWGSSFVVVRVLLNEGLTPTAIATFRFLTASPMFLAVLVANKVLNRKYALSVAKSDIPRVLVLALTGVTFFFIAQYTGIQMASPSIAAIMTCLLSPLFITILSALVFKEILVRKQILGIAVAVVGTSAIIAGGSLELGTNSSFFLGTLILLLTPVLWTTYTLSGKSVMKQYSPFLVSAYSSVLGGLCLVPFSLAEGSLGKLLSISFQSWAAILFLAFTCSLIGYFIWFYVANQVGAAVVSSFLFAEPLITALFATTFVGETITLFTAVGGLLVFVGVYLVSRK